MPYGMTQFRPYLDMSRDLKRAERKVVACYSSALRNIFIRIYTKMYEAGTLQGLPQLSQEDMKEELIGEAYDACLKMNVTK